MGVNNVDDARSDPIAMHHVLRGQETIECFFCMEKISGSFCYWVARSIQYFHPECGKEFGLRLIIDSNKAAFYKKGDSATHRDFSHCYGNRPIRMTGSGGSNEREGRFDRLSTVLSYAAGKAAVKRHVDDRVFLASILAVDDHKGSLSVLWQNQAAAISFGPLMVDAWVFVNELEESVEHYVMKDEGPQSLYYGRDPRNSHDPHYRSMECTFT